MLAAHLLPIENAVCVTVKVSNTSSSKFAFSTEEGLKGKKIIAIEAFSSDDIYATSTGEPVLNRFAFGEAFLTISQKGVEKISSLPLRTLHSPSNNGLVKFFNDIEPDMQKSYISFASTANLVKDESVLLVFYFK